MVQIRVTREGETVPLEADDGMREATDEQVLAYVTETLNANVNDYQVERTGEGILVHPRPVYG